ncbi:MAG: putative lipopolysaccharide heptosyltransferase III [Magnetococcales bacterium]|nr:putative lipopolysaccharide heptosyltransferase III [Magnetococcales bacterium]
MPAPDVTPPARILVIKARHLGDVLLTGPLFSALRGRHPQAWLVALVKGECAAMLAGHPHVDEVLTFPQRQAGEGKGPFFVRQWRWFAALRARRFDWVINTTEGDRGIVTAFLAAAPRRSGVWLRREKWWRRLLLTERVDDQAATAHTVLRNLHMVGAGARPEVRRVEWRVSVEERATVRARLLEQGWDGQQPLIQVHPTSRWLFKCWTDSGMAHVIDFLQGEGYRVVLTGAPSPQERYKNSRIVSLCRRPPIDMSGRLTVRQLAALTARCRLFFGVDTAPAHMAAALDVPVVVLFGPSGARLWGPWPNGWGGQGSPYPQRGGVQQAGPHTVIQKGWECVSCGRDGCHGSKVSRCLEELEVDEVLPVLERVLARLQVDAVLHTPPG